MEKFIDKLANRKFNFDEEIDSIERLLKYEDNYGNNANYYIDSLFLNWHLRNNFISCDDLLEGMGISRIVSKAISAQPISLEEFIYYCEFILNVTSIIPDNYGIKSTQYILTNIKNITENLNYEIKYFDEGIKIVEKDFNITEASEIVQDTYNLGEELFLYRHRSLNGNLNKKADILCRLYKYFEGKEKILNSNNFTKLASDIGFMSDKLDVRHKPDKKQATVLSNMSKEEQEKWYDELFNLYLSAIILADNIEKRQDINELKKKFEN